MRYCELTESETSEGPPPAIPPVPAPTDAVPVRQPIKSFAATEDLMQIAIADTDASEYRHLMLRDAHGVVVGGMRALDRAVVRGDTTLTTISRDWHNTLAFIRAKYGNKIVLYRADAPVKEHNPSTLTLYFASRKMAERYNSADRSAKPYIINTNDIVAVYAQRNNYYEVIVRRRGGLTPMMPKS